MEKLKETSPKPQKHRLKCIVFFVRKARGPVGFCQNGPWLSLLFENGDPKHCGPRDSMEPKPNKTEQRYILVWRSERQKGDYFLTPSAKSYEILYGDSSEKYENIQERKMARIVSVFS